MNKTLVIVGDLELGVFLEVRGLITFGIFKISKVLLDLY